MRPSEKPIDWQAWTLARRRIGLVVVVAVVLMPMISVPVQSLAAVCSSPAETAAVQLRLLQSELVVAALSCRTKTRYNAFATKFQPTLVASGRVLVRMFKLNHRRHGSAELNRFITRLANTASMRGIRQGAGYCRGASVLFDTVLALPAADLAAFSALRLNGSDSGVRYPDGT